MTTLVNILKQIWLDYSFFKDHTWIRNQR